MHITLSADDELIRRTRELAARRGITLDQMIQDYMKEITNWADIERDVQEFAEIARKSGGSSQNEYVFNRDEIHERQ